MTSCWVVTEGIAGTENQCLGVAEALGVMPEVKRVMLRFPWRTISPWGGPEPSFAFTGDLMAPPWPDLVISSGRKAIGAARYIRKRAGNQTMIVQIQDPRGFYDLFDLVCVPAHDPAKGDHVIRTVAAPNRITPLRLQDAAQEFTAQFLHLPVPRVAVMIGGNSKAYHMSVAATRNLCDSLISLADSGYGVMVTASRRTGAQNRAILENMLRHDNIFLWDGQGSNPYFGMLGCADFIMVTADSVSMLSEAASTGKPVYMIPLAGGHKRIDRLHKNLIDGGYVRPFEGILEKYRYAPLQDAALIAAAVKKRLKP